MTTVTRASSSSQPPPTATIAPRSSRLRTFATAVAGPGLIVACVLFATRGFAFAARLSNQHPDILSFWLPRSCFMGRSLSAGHVPLWNPFELAGTPFAADPQSGWLSAPSMLLSWGLGCGDGLRALIVLNPILAGLGLWWFLRKEGLGRVPATAGGLALSMAIGASNLVISLPFSGSLAWSPWVLVGASGYFSARGWRRLPWLALAAFAWGQVATSHLSHGLVLCTAIASAYVMSRAIHERRNGRLSARGAVLLALAFLAFLPLANLAILIPRFALSARSSLQAGYGALEGTVVTPRLTDPDRPIPEHGLWAGWPLAVAGAPGGYLGATLLLSVALAVRDRARRYLVVGVATIGVLTYLLTITLLVGAGWFRSLVLALPFGDVYLHNPGRLRYLVFLVVPILGAVGIGSLLDDPPPFGRLLRWFAVGFGVFLLFPLVGGANPLRLLVFGLAAGGVLLVWRAIGGRRRWATIAIVGVLVLELLAAAVWSTTYSGGTVYFGLEGADRPVLVPGPQRVPSIDLEAYLEPTPFARILARSPDRYLSWVPPAAFYNKGYLFTQGERDWPALLLGRALLFGLHDALGYSPIQLPRYWSYIRATNDPLRVFYNASVIREPEPVDIRLLGIRHLIVHVGQRLPQAITGRVVEQDRGYLLLELDELAQPRASVVPVWREVDGARALEAVVDPAFDPSSLAVIEGDPGLEMADPATPGTATYRELEPEVVVVDATATAPSILVIRNAWDRGWSATVDGRPAPVLRTDHFLQGVPIPAGDHEVRLTYREPAIARGLLASAVAWGWWAIALVVALIVARRRADRSA